MTATPLTLNQPGQVYPQIVFSGGEDTIVVSLVAGGRPNSRWLELQCPTAFSIGTELGGIAAGKAIPVAAGQSHVLPVPSGSYTIYVTGTAAAVLSVWDNMTGIPSQGGGEVQAIPVGAATSANQSLQLTQETASAAALGTKTDAPATDGLQASSWSVVALLKGLYIALASLLTAFLARIPVLGQALSAASVPVVLASDQNGNPSVKITRPGNTTIYAVGDVVGTMQTVTPCGPAGANLIITGADLIVEVAALPAAMTTFTIHFFDAAVADIADNSPFVMSVADSAHYLGKIDLGAAALNGGSTLLAHVEGANLQAKLAAASTTLYTFLVTNGAFTPAANSEVYDQRIHAMVA